MDESKEEQIRKELLGTPLPTYKELSQKHKISYANIARLRREAGVPRFARAPRRPKDGVYEIQWMWRQGKELRIGLKDTLRRLDGMNSSLNNVSEIIERLRPYEPWIRYYTEGAPGYGSLSLFIAERSGVELENLRSRLKEGIDHCHQLLSIIDEEQIKGEVDINGTGRDISN